MKLIRPYLSGDFRTLAPEALEPVAQTWGTEDVEVAEEALLFCPWAWTWVEDGRPVCIIGMFGYAGMALALALIGQVRNKFWTIKTGREYFKFCPFDEAYAFNDPEYRGARVICRAVGFKSTKTSPLPGMEKKEVMMWRRNG